MKKWCTELRAIDPKDGELKTWCGPIVEGLTQGLAEKWCQENGLGYLKIAGELVAEVDWEGNVIDHELPQQN
jgi:hypothetical protein